MQQRKSRQAHVVSAVRFVQMERKVIDPNYINQEPVSSLSDSKITEFVKPTLLCCVGNILGSLKP